MFNVANYPEIIIHVKSVSRVFSMNSAGWIGCFCPYCDDATRKFNPTDGHFWISSTFPYAHCFRCGVKVSLYNYLVYTGFTDSTILKHLHNLSKIAFSGDTSKSASFERSKVMSIDFTMSKMQKVYVDTQINYPAEYIQFKHYLTSRCLDINPVKFFIVPYIYKNNNEINSLVAFYNYDGLHVTSRSISTEKSRYFKSKDGKNYYFFQNINNIDQYSNIVICEGAFDLINLYNFYPQFNDSFFIAIGTSNYKGLLTNLITTFLLIGEYNIKIVFDKGVKRLDQIKRNILSTTNILNPQIGIEMFEPTYSKDVSELMLLTQIG